MSREKNPEQKRRIFRLPKLTLEDDIRYRGPLSYQHFQIFGWTCIVLTFVIVMIKLAVKVNADMEPRLAGWADVLSYFSDLSLPFLLVANFSMILDSSSGYRKQLIKNGAAMAGIALAFLLFFNRYILGTFQALDETPEDTLETVSAIIRSSSESGFYVFNIFVDLFLCTIFMFFLNYKPRKIFTGKARFIFRLFALFPIAYEAACIYFKTLSGLGSIEIPVNCYPLLTVKPPMTFALFVVLAFFIKTRELRFRRRGGTHEEYQQFLLTNRNSLHFSVFAGIQMLIFGVLDIFVLIFGAMLLAGGDEELTYRMLDVIHAAGFGESAVLVILAPFMLLYSYTREPKKKIISTLIPAAGIILIIMIFIQGFYQVILTANLPKTDLTELGEAIQEMIEALRMPGALQ